jgi:signal transduction histidine kinase
MSLVCPPDSRRFAILYVDDEEKALKYFTRAFADEFRILTATSAAEGAALLERHGDDIGLLLTDQRMPGEQGVQLLERARRSHPRIGRMLVTAYADQDATADAVNLGSICRYVAKPWETEDMRRALRHAMELFLAHRERDELLREKLGTLQELVVADRVFALGVLSSGVGYWLRNELSAVLAFLELLPEKLRRENIEYDRLQDAFFWRKLYGFAREGAGHISEVLDSLCLVAQDPPVRFDVEVDPARVIAEALQRHEPELRAKGIEVQNLITGPLPAMRVDGERFARIFDLLLRNELKQLPRGGKITWSAQVASVEGGPVQVEIVMRDDGPGLPREKLRALFNPFLIRENEPKPFHGFNLLGAYLLVYYHGGHVEARSVSGEGLTLHLTLPVNFDPATEEAATRRYVNQALFNAARWDRLNAEN